MCITHCHQFRYIMLGQGQHGGCQLHFQMLFKKIQSENGVGLQIPWVFAWINPTGDFFSSGCHSGRKCELSTVPHTELESCSNGLWKKPMQSSTASPRSHSELISVREPMPSFPLTPPQEPGTPATILLWFLVQVGETTTDTLNPGSEEGNCTTSASILHHQLRHFLKINCRWGFLSGSLRRRVNQTSSSLRFRVSEH